jgi:gliding motility-associated-like protein
MKYIVLGVTIFLSMTLSATVHAGTLKYPVPAYDVANDTMFFDLSKALFSGNGPYYYDIPVIVKSNGPISNFDFWFKYNQSEMTYDSTINMVSALDPYTYYNPFNQFLSNTTSGPIASYNIPKNTTLIYLRFKLASACTLIDSDDFNSITTLLNGSECKHKFINLGSGSSFLGISTTSLCEGDTAYFSGPINVNGKSVSSWSWDFGNGVSANTQLGSAIYDSGVYSVILNVTTNEGCVYSANQTLNVGAIPVASFSFSVSPDQDSVFFTNTSDLATYLWDFGDGMQSTASDPIRTYMGGGFFPVSLTATNKECSSTYFDTVLVDRPTAKFIYNGKCARSEINFTNQSSYANGTIASYQWDFGDVNKSSSKNPVNIYGVAGVYTVTLTVTGSNGLQSIYKEDITIDNKPIVMFSNTSESGCSPLSTSFVDKSVTDPASIYYWNFGDNTFSLLKNPAKIYSNAGQYTVKLTVSSPNGCIDSLIKLNYVTVLESPIAEFEHEPACINTPIQFNEVVQSGNTNSSWSWNFGNGATSNLQNPLCSYPSEGNFSVTLDVTNSFGCSDEVTKTLFVRNKPKANFISIDNLGCVPLSVSFTNTSNTSAGSSYTWDFGNGAQSTVVNPKKIFGESGLFSVRLISTAPGGCADTITKKDLIQVLSGVVANFQVNQNCAGGITKFEDLSVSTSGNVQKWNWSFGNGFTADVQNPQVVYNQPGTYTAQLAVVTDQGCSDTISLPIGMDLKPIVSFTAPSAFGCAPYTVKFSNNSTHDDGSGYLWDFGNGSISTLENPTNIYNSTANYDVKLIVTKPNGCKDSLVQNNFVQLQNPSIADFTLVEDTLFYPESQSFVKNHSLDASTYLWSFGDGYTSNLLEPAHYYEATGEFEICLTSKSLFGCESKRCDTIVIIESSSVAVPSAFTPNGDGKNDVFLVRGGPFRSFQMKVFNEWGNLVFSSNDPLLGWDGTYSGKLQPSGAFEYVIVGEELNGAALNEYGVINLKRY